MMSFPSNCRRWTGELLDYRTAGQLGDRWPVGSFITGRVVSTTIYLYRCMYISENWARSWVKSEWKSRTESADPSMRRRCGFSRCVVDRGSFAVPYRARLMPTKPATTTRSKSFSVGFTFGLAFFCHWWSHTLRVFYSVFSGGKYLFLRNLLSGAMYLRLFSGIHPSNCTDLDCTCLSHTISLGERIFSRI